MLQPLRRLALSTACCAAWGASALGAAQGGSGASPFAFDEVTQSAGLSGTGPSFGGGAWGDFDGDGHPDLWVGNHANHPSLWRNQGDGSFVDIAAQVWAGDPFADTHGAAWADFDGDGDQDLLETVGASFGQPAPNQMWVNEQGTLIDRAAALGLDFPAGRGRMPLWADWNGDQRLDVLLVNLYRPGSSSTVGFAQTVQPGGAILFQQDWPGSGYQPPTANAEQAHLADLTDDGHLEMIVDGSPYPHAVWDIAQQPMQDLLAGSSFQGFSGVVDAVYADFDGDLRNDVFLARDKIESGSEAVQLDGQTVQARLLARREEIGFDFQAAGSIAITFTDALDPRSVRLGANGLPAPGHDFELDPADPRWHGIAPHQPGVDRGVWLGFDVAAARWVLLLSTPGRSDLRCRMRGVGGVRDVREIGFSSALYPQDELLLRRGAGFVRGSVDVPGTSRSVVAGDFDNDTDVDLYLLRSGNAANRPNVLLENQGDGSFLLRAAAGAQAGFAGANGSPLGIGDGVTTADVDGDGWLDLFVSNGWGDRFLGGDGPYQLFRNRGAVLHPQRHWLQIDLVGPGANRDAVGARVRLRAGGVAQQREQNHGAHRLSQNHTRLHFGLGESEVVDELEVRWPDGTVTRLQSVAADRILEIRY